MPESSLSGFLKISLDLEPVKGKELILYQPVEGACVCVCVLTGCLQSLSPVLWRNLWSLYNFSSRWTERSRLFGRTQMIKQYHQTSHPQHRTPPGNLSDTHKKGFILTVITFGMFHDSCHYHYKYDSVRVHLSQPWRPQHQTALKPCPLRQHWRHRLWTSTWHQPPDLLPVNICKFNCNYIWWPWQSLFNNSVIMWLTVAS